MRYHTITCLPTFVEIPQPTPSGPSFETLIIVETKITFQPPVLSRHFNTGSGKYYDG